ncbi:MATE family efflux transporter [Aliidongia dinghuensis]|uniref:MATE family efflux transporter n=1 Tax=Aliidongia dinghuensis TaxID=1867774 RepID=A0A8J3E287_9PROT|nr:MATE family efflux transporter [Aliidongia dinghuensis]GGF18897.1 MATE family efflux transporter [Aliidongia dinghuensis]
MGKQLGTTGAARVSRLCRGPIIPTLLALAAPMVLVLSVQASINLVETHFIGVLGTDALAGAALVFPVALLMQMVASGGLGGGIASAVARAVGAGERGRAAALTAHGLVLATVAGLASCLLGLLAGPALYRTLGGSGPTLAAALAYSNTIFAGIVLIWWSNALVSALRGSGDMATPALVILLSAGVAMALSPCLIQGLGPFPRLGLVGAGLAFLSYYALCTLGFLAVLVFGDGGLVPGRPARFDRLRFDRALFGDILSVGGLSTVMTLQSSLSTVVVTGLAGGFGSLLLAGYGIGSRLDALLVPPLFGLGSATVTMVGINVGAGETQRAERIAWLGALVAALAMEAIGLLVTVKPRLWLGLFSDDAAVLAAGARYLRAVAPFYGCLGVGTILHFAALGAGRPRGPLVAISARMLVAAGGGFIVVHLFAGGPHRLFVMVAGGLVAFAVVNAAAVLNGSLRRGGRPIGSAQPARPPKMPA